MEKGVKFGQICERNLKKKDFLDWLGWRALFPGSERIRAAGAVLGFSGRFVCDAIGRHVGGAPR